MATRTQLNININPDLLRSVKQQAIKSGMTLGDYVSKLIESYLKNQGFSPSGTEFESRIEVIEKELNLISSQIKDLNNNPKRISSTDTSNRVLSDSDVIQYSHLLEKQFKNIAREEMLSDKEAWRVFTKQADAKNINKDNLHLIQDILRGERVLNLDETIAFIKFHRGCPVIPCFISMSRTPILPKLFQITECINTHSKQPINS
ncbi:hypothetical protein [Prochlorococcus marinus]|uniref:hypothetical protein n=1 Tax=Prochlorococcus marinus TaxID=1219 RepID=UPI0016508A95|nr:hypothetical protein [Prochlorococcus marinus]